MHIHDSNEMTEVGEKQCKAMNEVKKVYKIGNRGVNISIAMNTRECPQRMIGKMQKCSSNYHLCRSRGKGSDDICRSAERKKI